MEEILSGRSALVKRLVKNGHDVTVVDNLSRGRREFLVMNEGSPVIDLEEKLIVRDLATPGVLDPLIADTDYVFHLADVVAGIDYVFKHQGEIFRQNLLINSNVIASLRRSDVRGVVYVGTACSFPAHLQSGAEAAPLREEQQYPANPESAYGWSKLMGEYEMLLMEKETKIPVSILSLHNVYGEPCEFGPKTSQVIPSLIRKAIGFPKDPFVVWGSGNQGRAFVHVEDAVDALVAAPHRGMGHGVIQIGPDVCSTIRQVAEHIVEVSRKDIPIIYDTDKPEGDRGRRADFSKAQRVLGWSPTTTLENGLRGLYRWIEDRISAGQH